MIVKFLAYPVAGGRTKLFVPKHRSHLKETTLYFPQTVFMQEQSSFTVKKSNKPKSS